MQRDLKIDGLKFLLIFLVVLGHLSYHDYGIELNKMIYSFHMPVFVFLSGYLTSLKSNSEKHAMWLKKTAIIFLLAQFAHIIMAVAFRYLSSTMSNTPPHHLLSLGDFIYPKIALWYLLCLIYWRFITWKVFDKNHDLLWLIGSFILSIIVGIIPIGETFSFQRAFAFFPFFILGLVFKQRNWAIQLDKVPLLIPVMIIIIGFIVARELPLFQPRYHYIDWGDAVLRAGQSILGCLLCLSVIRLSRASKLLEKFAHYGMYTLWIYVGHTFLITIERKLLPQFGITYNIFIALVIAVIYCALFIFIAKLYHARHRQLK